MSNEISIQVSMLFSKGGAQCGRSDTISVDVAGEAFTHQVQLIPVANTALDVGAAIGTAGYVLVKNLSATYFISVGLTGSYTIKLLPGEFALFRAAGAIYVLPDTGACYVEYWIIEA